MNLVQIGGSIKKHRERKGVSLRQAARDIETHPSNIYRYENNKVTPELPILWKLADYYNVSLDDLVGRVDYT